MSVFADDPQNAVLGVDIGGTNIKWVLLRGKTVLADGTAPTPSNGPEKVADLIARFSLDVAADRVGVALPGHLSGDERCTTVIPNIAGDWSGFPFADCLRERLGLPVALANDARTFAIAELMLGAGRGLRDALFMTVGTGIGSAVALRGEVLRGPAGAFGEIGHLQVSDNRRPCGCGSVGCLETVAGGRALATTWQVAAGHSGCGVNEDLTAKHLVVAAKAGNADALTVLARAGKAVGEAMGNALAFLGVRSVIVGGGAAPALEFMLPAAERAMQQREALLGTIDIRHAILGTRGGAIGAALNALHSCHRPGRVS